MTFQAIFMGSFNSGASVARHDVLLPQGQPDKFVLRNRTAWGDDAAETSVESSWFRGDAQGSAKTIDQAVTTGAMSTEAVTTGGFTFFDTANPPVFAALANTTITGNAGTFIVSMASTGDIAVGDTVRLLNEAGEQQISGYLFQVTAVTANVSITLGYMASSGITFAAAATSGFVQKIIPGRFYPHWNYIANITQASQAVVSFTRPNDFTPGEIVSFRVPSQFGMDEINNLPARVLSVTNSATVSSIVIDLDTSGFTAFTFPTSAVAAAGVSPAIVVPSSSGVVPEDGSATVAQEPPGTNLRDAFDNRNVFVCRCGTNVITSADSVYEWEAYYATKFQQE